MAFVMSFTIQSRPVSKKDSLNKVVINLKAVDDKTLNDLGVFLRSNSESLSNKTNAISELNSLLQDYNNQSVLEKRYKDYGISKSKIVEQIKLDSTVKLTTSTAMLILITIAVMWLINYTIKNQMSWQYTLIYASLLIIVSFLCNEYVYYIISYLFNNGYLITKEIHSLIN